MAKEKPDKQTPASAIVDGAAQLEREALAHQQTDEERAKQDTEELKQVVDQFGENSIQATKVKADQAARATQIGSTHRTRRETAQQEVNQRVNAARTEEAARASRAQGTVTVRAKQRGYYKDVIREEGAVFQVDRRDLTQNEDGSIARKSETELVGDRVVGRNQPTRQKFTNTPLSMTWVELVPANARSQPYVRPGSQPGGVLDDRSGALARGAAREQFGEAPDVAIDSGEQEEAERGNGSDEVI